MGMSGNEGIAKKWRETRENKGEQNPPKKKNEGQWKGRESESNRMERNRKEWE